MPSRSRGRRASQESYASGLRDAISRLLPHRGLALLETDQRICWTPRLLVMGAVLMAWEASATLKDRFAAARACVAEMYPTRRRPGGTYEGFVAALARHSQQLLAAVEQALREAVESLARQRRQWTLGGWCVFGCDSTKIDCPQTVANERCFGCASKKGSWPQQLLTVIFHAGSGLPWCFTRGAATASERQHLRSLLSLLPAQSMLLMDAGFTGYELLREILAGGRQFVMRVGSNVRLLKKLGYAAREYDGIVYLWPQPQQKRRTEPLVLRLIRLSDGRGRSIYLLSSVLQHNRLSDRQAGELYRRRWGIELMYRALKQTMRRRKMLSTCPSHAQVELDWSVVGLWMLGAVALSELSAPAATPAMAKALRVVRCWMQRRPSQQNLGDAHCGDDYHRRTRKRSRHWPKKKRIKPPARPKARMASPKQIALAREVRETKAAA